MSEEEDVLIYVDNDRGNDRNDGSRADPLADSIHGPVETADRAFSLLPPFWQRRAEIVFAVTGRPYPIRTNAIYLGEPVGPRASSLIIRGGYSPDRDFPTVDATGGNGDDVRTNLNIPADALIGAVLTRQSAGSSPAGTAISIRGNTEGPASTILLQGSMSRSGITRGDLFRVERPAVTLEPVETLTLVSHDGRSPNLELIGIRITPREGKGLILINVRAHCDTCEFSFQRSFGTGTKSITFFLHTHARIQGGSEDPSDLRARAGVYINSNDTSNIIWTIRGGILGGHLTFDNIAIQISQGGVFFPMSLEARVAPIRIMAGGFGLAPPAGWGTASNKARIRNAGDAEDGIRVVSGGVLNQGGGAMHLDIFGCRDGIRLDSGSSASFANPGGVAGLVTTGRPNRKFGMNIRNASRALIGTDAATARVPPGTTPTPLTGEGGQVALDDELVRDPSTGRTGWAAIDALHPQRNEGLSLVRVNIGDVVP